MKTQYYTAASLDGFIATLDDCLEWLFSLGRIEDTSYPSFIRHVGALAMGSATYEWMFRHLVGSEAEGPQPWPAGQTCPAGRIRGVVVLRVMAIRRDSSRCTTWPRRLATCPVPQRRDRLSAPRGWEGQKVLTTFTENSQSFVVSSS